APAWTAHHKGPVRLTPPQPDNEVRVRDFRKSSGAFWPKHNLISTRSNHTRETLTATPAKDAAPFIVSQLTQDSELS
ncbi:MAG: hypothetical protein WAO16_25440, partial [Pseudolabrys sp.]